MAQVKLKGSPVHTLYDNIRVGQVFPDFSPLVKTDLSELSLADLKGKRTILNIYPSIDTGTCAKSVKDLNEKASQNSKLEVVCISKDLPFALDRFFKEHNIRSVIGASAFRSDFGRQTGLELKDSPLAGLIARALIVLDENHKVLHFELVEEITVLPNYEKALSFI
ncbi:hypothetical protein CHS0354_018572 [Potamilus streckersoni]|uniref:Peroxiredoxin-5, mitochondrial n=1 Tax=Potamilus streckersoni TaxID=2493646 RepID=A0AAE0WA22_9BIVA|nr:hypothetical protein CHS0354_018572 [Potamilus streckersoni]